MKERAMWLGQGLPDPRFKTIGWLKNCLRLSSVKGQSNEYQGFLGIWWLKVISPHCDAAAFT